MSCFNYTYNNQFGGSGYISGTTCLGNIGAFTLNFGDSICMDNDFPIISCEQFDITDYCINPTPSITPTNTNTPSPTLLCLVGTGLTASSVVKLVNTGSTMYIGAFGASQYNGTPISNLLSISEYGSLIFSAASINSSVNEILLQSDSKIMIGGGFTTVGGVSRNYIARINADGTLDTTFIIGTGFGGPAISIQTIAQNSSGDYFVGGQFTSYSGVARNNIIKLTSNGSIDNTFSIGTGANGLIQSILIQPDNKIIVAGWFTSYSSTTANRIVRLNTNGTIDNTFSSGSGFGFDVWDAKLQADGKIICVGDFNSYNGTSVSKMVRLNSGGTIDNTFTSLGFDNLITDVAIDVDGNYIVAGFFTTYNGITQNRIVKLNPDGTLFAGWNSGSGKSPQGQTALATFPDKKIMVGGPSNQTYNGYIASELFLLNEYGTFINCNPIAVTPTRTPTATPTPEPTPPNTETPTETPTNTPTNTMTPTPSTTIGLTPTMTPSNTETPLPTPTNTTTPTTTPTNTATPSATPLPSLRMVPQFQSCNTDEPSLDWTITYSGITYPVEITNAGNTNILAACVPVAYPQIGTTYSFQANVSPGCGQCFDSLYYNYDRIDYTVVSSLGDYFGIGPGWSANTTFYSGGTQVFNEFSGSTEDVLWYYYPQYWAENPDSVLSGCSQPILYTTYTIGYPQFAFTCAPQPTPTNTATPTNTPTNTTTPTNTPTNTATPTPTLTATTLCIDITTNNSLDISITQIKVNDLIASVTGGSMPNTPGNGTNLEVTLSAGTYDLQVAYTCSVTGQRIEIVSPITGYACQNTSTGGNIMTFAGVGFSNLTCLQITAQDGTC